ncbi:monocarboxylate transporter 13-like [Pecten maximus]|uniref:monocarboxylate transporter 13-like n=1 Tax=Pecten maximus TaxID=6579 RepID=UPI0014586AE7|nr:monocarboxylate transporter 13-like [Pecten maximus]
MSETEETEEDHSSHFLPDQRERFGDEHCELPIDQGWAWVVLAASTVINILYAGVLKSFGIFFVEILDVYGGTVSTTSLILGLQFTVYCTANVPVLMILLRYQSVRRCQLVGIILSALAYALSSLTNRLELLILCQSLLNGLSIALIVPTGIVQVSKYFRKRIGLANGILMAGLSLGGLVMPPMIQLIVLEYTLHGALLLTSGIIFNALPAAVLQRPPEFYRRIFTLKRKNYLGVLQHIISSDSKDTKIYNKKNHPLVTEHDNQMKYKMSTSEGTLPIALGNKMMKKGEPDLQLTTNSLPNLLHSGCEKYHNQVRHHRVSIDAKDLRHFSSMSAFECADVSSISFSQQNVSTEENISDMGSQASRSSRHWLRIMLTQCKESGVTLLKNRSFLIFVGFYTTGTISNETITTYLPPYAKETGIESTNVAMLISIHSVCDFVGRLLSGYLADTHWIKKHHLILVSQVFTAILPQLNYFYDSFLMFSIFAALFGLMSGIIFAISNPLLKEIVGDENFAAAIGIAIFVKGVVLGGMVPLLGFLRDATCTYHVTFHCMGATSCVAVCILILFGVVFPKHSS